MEKSVDPITLIIATRNAHKVGEIRVILGESFSYRTLNDFPNPPKVVEDANTFAGNATKKAVELAQWLAISNLNSQISNSTFVLADDSGLEVDALKGAPGVHSARFAALDGGHPDNSPDAENNAKLLRLLTGVPAEHRTARFRCVIALTPVVPVGTESASPVCSADERELQTQIFEGACEGRIDFAPCGQGGFGYDPLFVPNGFQNSFAELGETQKNQISHGSKALAKLKSVIIG
ncbi:MAG: non-canonical purine NTP pyrophosphatase [Verrucomicrobiota bacterium]